MMEKSSSKRRNSGRVLFDSGEDVPLPPELQRRKTILRKKHEQNSSTASAVENSPENESSSTTQDVPLTDIFISGAAAGMIGRTCTAPLDRMKILLQAGKAEDVPKFAKGSLGPRGSLTRSPLGKVFRHILMDAGIFGFWRGNGANVLKVMPESAAKFMVYEAMKASLKIDDSNPLSVGQRLLCGSVAGGISQVAIYPLDFTKTRLAASQVGQYRGIFDCIFRTVKFEGFRALYKGIFPALGAIVPAVGVELAMYNTLKEWYLSRSIVDNPSIPIQTSLVFGAISAISGAVIAYPLALTRTKLITQGMPGRPMLYDGAVDCIMRTFREQGIVGLYRGQVPSLLKTVPAITIGYGVFEMSKNFLSQRRESQ